VVSATQLMAAGETEAQFLAPPVPFRMATCAGESTSPHTSANGSLSSISRSRRRRLSPSICSHRA